MAWIKLPVDLTEDEFVLLCAAWDKDDEAEFRLSPDFSLAQVVRSAEIALLHQGRKYALVVLADVAEYPSIPVDLLKAILSLEDQACKESVCMRVDLDDELYQICEKSNLVHGLRKRD